MLIVKLKFIDQVNVALVLPTSFALKIQHLTFIFSFKTDSLVPGENRALVHLDYEQQEYLVR